MRDTPRTDAAWNRAHTDDIEAGWLFAQQLERELNEADADRLRLREALAQAGAGQFLDAISATPPPPVVELAEANADRLRLREALESEVSIVSGELEALKKFLALNAQYYEQNRGRIEKYINQIQRLGDFLKTPPLAVVAKADADALADACKLCSEIIGSSSAEFPEGWAAINKAWNAAQAALGTYRTKYP
jgi:hypothetical protein